MVESINFDPVIKYCISKLARMRGGKNRLMAKMHKKYGTYDVVYGLYTTLVNTVGRTGPLIVYFLEVAGPILIFYI